MDIKERILAASHELFFKFGIKSITMDDIARHLAISKKTIYQFYKDKNEIVEKFTDEILKNHQAQFDKISVESKNAIHEMIEIMKYMEPVFRHMNPNLFYDMQKYHRNAWKKFREFKEGCVMGKVEENMQKGIAQGLYRNNINTKIMARLRIEEVEMAMNPEVFTSEMFDLPSVQISLLDHFLHGITTIKGHKLINKYKQIEEEE